MVLLTVMLSLLALYKFKNTSPFSLKWMIVLAHGIAFLSVTEWLCLNVFFKPSFFLWNDIKPILKTLKIQDTNFIGSFHYFAKFIFLGLFFRDSLQKPIWKKVFQYAVWALVVFELVQVFVFKSYQGYDSLSSTVKNFFILGGAGLLLYRVYKEPNINLSIQKNPYFWICLGLILPALAELFLEFIFTKLYQTDLVSFYKLYLVRNASQMVGFTLLIVGVWQAKYLKYLPKSF